MERNVLRIIPTWSQGGRRAGASAAPPGADLLIVQPLVLGRLRRLMQPGVQRVGVLRLLAGDPGGGAIVLRATGEAELETGALASGTVSVTTLDM